MDNQLSSSPGSSSADEGSVKDSNMPRHPHGRNAPKRSELDLSSVLNLEQKNQLQALVNVIMDQMQKQIKDTFEGLGNGQEKSEDGIKPFTATWNLIPNPRSIKYANLFGLSSGGSPTQETTATLPGNQMDSTNPQNPGAQNSNIQPTEAGRVGPHSQGGVNADAGAVNSDVQTAEVSYGAAKASSGVPIPKSPEEASLLVKKDEHDVLVSSLAELKRDTLTSFGKWRVNVSRRIGDIAIKNGGNGSNPPSQGSQQVPGNFRRPGSSGRGGPSRPSGLDPSTAESNAALVALYPPSATPLYNLSKEKRTMLLHSMLLILLSLENYASYSRILLLYLASSLHIPIHVLSQDEVRVAQGLSDVVKQLSAEEIAQKRAEEGKSSRRWKVGLASVAGAAIIGITGGLATPLVAAGIGTVFGGLGLGATAAASLLGGMAHSTVVVGTLFGLYGARAGGKMIDVYAKEIQDFALLPLHGSLQKEFVDAKDIPPEDRRLRVTLGISGWLTEEHDVVNPWRVLGQQSEVYALRWEVESLMKLGTSLETLLKSAAWTLAKKEIIQRTVFASLMHALWPMALVKVSKIVDNPWNIGMVRAEKAGLILADAIINKIQGERNITLIGYSVGARVIYSCLMALSEKRAFGLVENVVLMGAPCPSDIRVWGAMKSVVAGRLVNVYSKNDYILGFLYRSSSWQFGVAGLQKIQGVPGVENFDVSDIVSGHLRYQYLVGTILKKMGWEDVDYARVSKDEETLAHLIDDEKKRDTEREKRAEVDINQEVKKVEQEVEEKSEEKALEKQMGDIKLDQ